MIERLLAAEHAMDLGQVDVAERLFGQVAAADPRNAIAVVGLARVARRRQDLPAAAAHARRALEIDPQDAAAIRLLAELEAASRVEASTEAEAPREVEPPPAPRRRGLLAWLRRMLGR